MSTCSATHVDHGYGYRPNIIVPCFREVDADGRHRGKHQAWQDMPAGESKPWSGIGDVTRWDAWRRLWTFDESGASGSSRHGACDLEPCPLCGVLAPPVTDGGIQFVGSPDAYAAGDGNLGGACYDCRTWANRIAEYPTGWGHTRATRVSRLRTYRWIRLRDDDGKPSDRLRAWHRGVTGAFAGWKVTVRWDDGEQVGPESSMWDAGRIPWWLDDRFPPNAVLVPAEVKV